MTEEARVLAEEAKAAEAAAESRGGVGNQAGKQPQKTDEGPSSSGAKSGPPSPSRVDAKTKLRQNIKASEDGAKVDAAPEITDSADVISQAAQGGNITNPLYSYTAGAVGSGAESPSQARADCAHALHLARLVSHAVCML